MKRYADRAEAGRVVARALEPRLQGTPDPIVLGIPRGGVVVADEVARALRLPLDVLAVEKIGAPWNPELAVGAVGEREALWLDDQLARQVDPEMLRGIIERERSELSDKLDGIRRLRPRQGLVDRTAVVVDDGIATGSTVRAGLLALAAAGPARRILAIPVGPPETISSLQAVADLVVCPLQPATFYAVGQWYEQFEQVSEAAVVAVLEAAMKREAGPGTDRGSSS